MKTIIITAALIAVTSTAATAETFVKKEIWVKDRVCERTTPSGDSILTGLLLGGLIGNNTGDGDAAQGAIIGGIIGGIAAADEKCHDVYRRTGEHYYVQQ